MKFKFKKHQKIKLLRDANPEFIEYRDEFGDAARPIKKGMNGIINIILPNGQYHVEIIDEEGDVIAYAPFNEEDLEAVKE